MYRLPAATRLGSVSLAVSDLPRSVDFYQQILGLDVLAHSPRRASLAVVGANSPLLHLESPEGIRRPRGPRLGLYHFAFLVPDRPALGRFLMHTAKQRVKALSADHAVSEALYLWDPDGLGIEVYRDRPRHEWRMNGGELFMTTEPLSVRTVLEAADGPWRGMPPDTVLGHMHLHVGDLATAEAFYHRALGFDKTVWSYPGALFMAAGGYHHHLGTNTWAGAAPVRSEHDAGLVAWDLVLPSTADVQAAAESCARAGAVVSARDGHTSVTDPWGIQVRLSADS